MNARVMLRRWFCLFALGSVVTAFDTKAQTLINVDFGVGSKSAKVGFAATGQGTNDVWNLFRFYDPRYMPGTPLVYSGEMKNLKLADGYPTAVSIAVTNAPGVWGNASGDPMFDTYLFAQNGSNIVVTISHLDAGRYNFYLYGHADADASAEQNSIFRLRTAGTNYGPLTASSSVGWKANMPWEEGHQYVAFRDVTVKGGTVTIEVAPGPNGIAVLNGLQISSRGTSPPRFVESATAHRVSGPTNLVVHEIRYDGSVDDNQAKFTTDLNVESFNTNTVSTVLFEGDVAVTPINLPEDVRVVRSGKDYRLVVSKAGSYKLSLNVVAKIKRLEPWNEISFSGPPAAIASVHAQGGSGVEIQLLSGTALEGEKADSKIDAFLNADRVVSFRWQSRGTEVARKALINVTSSIKATVSATLVRMASTLQYEVLQAPVARLRASIPKEQSLTKLEGEQIRDWKVDNGILTVEFIKPVEKSYSLTLWTEQALSASTELAGPQPMDVERETGSVLVFAEDAQVDIPGTSGLRQINATDNALAAFRFYARPWNLTVKAKAIEPVVKSNDRVNGRLEETRFTVSHGINLHVEKSGIYSANLSVPAGFAVVDVRGEGIEEWKVSENKLRISFNTRVLGNRNVDVQLEQTLKVFPTSVTFEPMRVAGATKQTAQITVAAMPGLRVKTTELIGLREISVAQLADCSPSGGDALAFETEQGDWKLTLGTERLPARVTADVFNLLTIGDGVVGGSATVRYTLINQGVQEFRVSVPSHWKNIEFTGANIRGKEKQPGTMTNEEVWVISLQEKAWGGYTLVVTYDYQFDPKRATLNGAGLHVLNAEQENGSVAITTAANLKIGPKLTDVSTTTNHSGQLRTPLRQIDATELPEADAALITRPVLLAYRYTGDDYQLQLDVTRHQEEQLLDAVADRTQITSVITETGQMLTQASFMVKNNDRQFQRFQLPAGAEFWSCYVNGQAAKAERDKDWLLVPLPRTANRNEAFAVDLVYAQKTDAVHANIFPKPAEFLAPKTDVPNTYAEWEIYVPETRRVSGFGGTMTVARGTVYGLTDALHRFAQFYENVWQENGGILLGWTLLLLAATALILRVRVRGWTGAAQVGLVLLILGIVFSMTVPSFTRARSTSIQNAAMNDMRVIDGAIQQFTLENKGKTPQTMDDIRAYLGRGETKELVDPATGEPYVYSGAGKDLRNPNAIIAYSPVDRGGRTVLTGSGVQHMSSEEFAAALENENRAPVAGVGGSVMGGTVTDSISLGVEAPVASATPSSHLAVRAAGMPAEVLEDRSVVINGSASTATTTPPKVAGIRSIRIDIPHRGQPFLFTKVLNISGDPLAINLSMINATTFTIMRSSLQLATFVAGLLVLWSMWKRRAAASMREAFWFAIGLALTIGSVTALAITTRELHLLLIVLAPSILFAAFVWTVLKLWRKTTFVASKINPDAGLPPAMASIALLFLFGAVSMYARSEKQTAVPAATVVTANYSGNVGQQSAQFEGSLTVSSSGTNETLALFSPDVALQEFTVISGQAKLMQAGDSQSKISVLLPKPGQATIKVKFLAKLGGTVSKRELNFDLPSALSSKISVAIDEPEAEVEFPTAVSFVRTTAGQRTKIDAVIGSDDRFAMQWAPRVKRAAETAATVFVENHSLVTFGNGALALHTTLNYQIAQGELHQLRVKLPAKHRLLKVAGESLRTWELRSENGADVLFVELLKGVSPGYTLTIDTERLLDALPTTLDVSLAHALDVRRETGVVGIQSTEELSVSVTRASDLQRVDNSELSSNNIRGSFFAVITAYRFISPTFELTVRAEPVQPHVEAVVNNRIRIDTDLIRLTSQVDYTIKKAGVFELALGMPEGYRVESVSGENIAQWKTNNNVVTVSFKDRVLGNYALTIVLSKANADASKNHTLDIVGVQPLSTAQARLQKLTGFVVVSSEVGIGLKVLSFDGLTEVPAASVDSTSSLGYKFIDSEPTAAPSWELQVAVDFMAPWIRAEIANIFTVTETLIKGRAVVRYEIQNAPAREFRLKVPSAFHNVEITGANIRRRDQNGDEWKIELQNKVHGTFLLNVSWDQPRTSGTNAIALSGIGAVGVERETGTVTVKVKSPLQVQERSSSGELVRIDVRELPDWSGVSAEASGDTEAAVLVYRYLRPGFQLVIDATRYDEAAVLQALIDQAQLTTVVADDGELMTELSFAVRNNGLQHLEIELPAGDKVWSAFVGGQPVRPALRDGKLLLPLEDAVVATDEPVQIQLTYVGHEKFPKQNGPVNLISPKVDVPLKNARWDIYLPPDYRYNDFTGSMNLQHEVAPVVRTYSLSEYRVQEAEKKQARQADAKSIITKGKSSFQSNLRQLSRYKAEDLDDDASRRELGKLQAEAQRVQSSNLLSQNAPMNTHGGENTEALVAQKQLEKLQAVQELGVAHVQPLRVNLPLRGMHFGFTQVLQTEVHKPMTVHFAAANLHSANWFSRIAAVACAFVVLWIVAGIVLARRKIS